LAHPMRLPFPERIPLQITLIAATVLFALQQLQRTNPIFSIYCFLFIILANIAFNVAGGFSRPSGGYVFFYSILGLIFGLVYKAYLGEPADSNLRSPILTIQVFTGGIAAMLIAVIISRKLTTKKALLGTMLREKDMRNATIGATFIGCLLYLLSFIILHVEGSALSALAQLNRFLPLATIIGTIYAIRKSGGRTAINSIVLFILIVSELIGLIGFGKEAIFTPLFCWLFAAASLRYGLRLHQLVACFVIGVICVMYLVPYSQYGRDIPTEQSTLGDRISIAFTLLSDLGYVREQYALNQQEDFEQTGAAYYNKRQGFADRLTMITMDDLLISYTDQDHVAGFGQLAFDFINWVPHFLWPDKPTGGGGNSYAREIGGIVSEEDTTTGISFSPSAQAFHMARWSGVFLLAPAVWIMLFTLFDSLCGDTRKSPWGLLMIALFAHTAPEGMLSGAIYTMWYGSLAIIFTAVCAAYVLPIIGSLLAGPERVGLVRTRAPRSVPKRVAVLPSDVTS
jgi:hypothetical protein